MWRTKRLVHFQLVHSNCKIFISIPKCLHINKFLVFDHELCKFDLIIIIELYLSKVYIFKVNNMPHSVIYYDAPLSILNLLEVTHICKGVCLKTVIRFWWIILWNKINRNFPNKTLINFCYSVYYSYNHHFLCNNIF